MHLGLVTHLVPDLPLDRAGLLGRHVGDCQVAEERVALDGGVPDLADGPDRPDEVGVVTRLDSVIPEAGDTEGHRTCLLFGHVSPVSCSGWDVPILPPMARIDNTSNLFYYYR